MPRKKKADYWSIHRQVLILMMKEKVSKEETVGFYNENFDRILKAQTKE